MGEKSFDGLFSTLETRLKRLFSVFPACYDQITVNFEAKTCDVQFKSKVSVYQSDRFQASVSQLVKTPFIQSFVKQTRSGVILSNVYAPNNAFKLLTRIRPNSHELGENIVSLQFTSIEKDANAQFLMRFGKDIAFSLTWHEKESGFGFGAQWLLSRNPIATSSLNTMLFLTRQQSDVVLRYSGWNRTLTRMELGDLSIGLFTQEKDRFKMGLTAQYAAGRLDAQVCGRLLMDQPNPTFNNFVYIKADTEGAVGIAISCEATTHQWTLTSSFEHNIETNKSRVCVRADVQVEWPEYDPASRDEFIRAVWNHYGF